MVKSNPYFSIVIPSLDEEQTLPVLLSDLVDQAWTDFEVIHVDGNSDDRTVELSKKFLKKLDLKIINEPVRNVSTQRNRGGDMARGQWILFMDADNQLNTDFLLALRYKISNLEKKHQPIDAFSTLISLNNIDKKKSKHIISASLINSYLTSTSSTSRPNSFGALQGIKRSVFEKNHYDPKIRFAEDNEIMYRIIKNGGVFRLFTSPRYKYDMRRWDDSPMAKTIVEALKLQVQIAAKRNNKAKYDMKGGKPYKQKKS